VPTIIIATAAATTLCLPDGKSFLSASATRRKIQKGRAQGNGSGKRGIKHK